jgi:hypothetical protein
METIFLKQTSLPESIRSSLHVLWDALRPVSTPWMVGGSCGLLLQGVSLDAAPRDLDVYVDRDDAEAMDRCLADYRVDGPEWSETGMYRSLLSHYEIMGNMVELVGSLSVDTEGSSYDVRVGGPLSVHGPQLNDQGRLIPLMPLAHELVFNVLRKRPDRYETIARTMRAEPLRHESQLERLIAANALSEETVQRIRSLLTERKDG